MTRGGTRRVITPIVEGRVISVRFPSTTHSYNLAVKVAFLQNVSDFRTDSRNLGRLSPHLEAQTASVGSLKPVVRRNAEARTDVR